MTLVNKDITYRVGKIEDIVNLTYFLENIKEENPLVELFDYDLPKCAGILRRIIEQDQGVILLAENSGIILGVIVLGRTTVWWAGKELLTDLAFYVNPKFRHLGIQKRLLESVKDFANEIKMSILISVFNASEQNDKFARFLSIQGFKTVGFKALYTPKRD